MRWKQNPPYNLNGINISLFYIPAGALDETVLSLHVINILVCRILQSRFSNSNSKEKLRVILLFAPAFLLAFIKLWWQCFLRTALLPGHIFYYFNTVCISLSSSSSYCPFHHLYTLASWLYNCLYCTCAFLHPSFSLAFFHPFFLRKPISDSKLPVSWCLEA